LTNYIIISMDLMDLFIHKSVPLPIRVYLIKKKTHVAQTKLPDRYIHGDRLSKMKCIRCFILA